MDLASAWFKGNTAGAPRTGEPSAQKAIKDDFPMVVGKEAYALLKLYAIPKPSGLRPFTEIQEALQRHVSPARFKFVERAQFHTLDRNQNGTVRVSIVRLQRQAI